MTDSEKLFADVSVLLDYCLAHQEDQQNANRVLETVRDNGGMIMASKDAYQSLNELISKNQKLFGSLRDKATEYLREYECPEQAFADDILTYSTINSLVDFDINESYLPNIDEVKDYYEDVGIRDFRSELEDIQQQSAIQRRELRAILSNDECMFSKGGQSTMAIRLQISNISEYDAQKRSLIDAAFWCQSHGDLILVKHNSGPHSEREELLDAISNVSRNSVYIYSPIEVLEHS